MNLIVFRNQLVSIAHTINDILFTNMIATVILKKSENSKLKKTRI